MTNIQLINQYLNNFGLNQRSSIEDLKSSYRKLAKIKHPDCDGGNHQEFIELNKQYEFLLAHYSPKPNLADFQHLFRIFDINFAEIFQQPVKHQIWIPEQVLSKDTNVHCIGTGIPEFNIILKQGTKLPLTILVHDPRIRIPILLNIQYGIKKNE